VKKNAAQQALTNAVNRAIANGAPVYENQPVETPKLKTFIVTQTIVKTFEVQEDDADKAKSAVLTSRFITGTQTVNTVVTEKLEGGVI